MLHFTSFDTALSPYFHQYLFNNLLTRQRNRHHLHKIMPISSMAFMSLTSTPLGAYLLYILCRVPDNSSTTSLPAHSGQDRIFS